MAMSTADVAAAFRSDMRDEAAPYLWSDQDLLRYMNEAEREICDKAWGIRDASMTFDTDGANLITIHSSITKLKYLYITTTGREVPLKSYAEVNNPFVPSTSVYPSYFLTGLEEDKIKPHPAPITDLTIGMVVLRRPKVRRAAISDSDYFEVPDAAKQGILYYMRGLAYLKNDSETFDRGRADDMMAMFDVFADSYKHMMERQEYQPGSVIPDGDYML